MLRSFAVISVVFSVALAQQNPLVPQGISGPCTTFLHSLDKNAQLGTCLSAINKATAAFGVGTSTTPSAAALDAALTSLCGASTVNACPANVIGGLLASFDESCPNDLDNKQVQGIYESLYILSPLTESMCSSDDNGERCANAPVKSARELSEDVSGDSASHSFPELIALLTTPLTNGGSAQRRAPVDAYVPNMDALAAADIAFLTRDPSLDAGHLCTPCTRNIVDKYMEWESDHTYSPGLEKSLLLKQQTALFAAINGKCPVDFLANGIEAASGLGGSGIDNLLGGSAVSVERNGVLALLLSAVSLALAL